MVSTIASSILTQTPTSTTNAIESIEVVTSGESIVATGFSDAFLVNSLGQESTTAGSLPTGYGVGIMLTAVDASAVQGDTVGAFAGQ